MSAPKPLQVAYQGVPGAYAESAALAFYAAKSPAIAPTSTTHPLALVPVKTFEEVFSAVDENRLDHGFVPIETTNADTFPAIHKLLRTRNVQITAEFVVREHYHLIVNKGVRLEEITELRSHPTVLAQCHSMIAQLVNKKPYLTVTQDMSTALSAQFLSENPACRHVAAIASRRAAQIYGLDILEEAIEDVETVTRYFEISSRRTIPPPDANPKTALYFTLKNQAGALFKALSCFALRDINVSKIESRPQGGSMYPWSLDFFFTVDAPLNDESMHRALANLEEYVTACKILGSFQSTLKMEPLGRPSVTGG